MEENLSWMMGFLIIVGSISFSFVLDFRKAKGMGILKGEQIHSSLAAHLYGSFVHSWMDRDG
jgi:hypothetical protein